MKRTEIIALSGLLFTAATIAVIVVNDNRLMKQEKGSTDGKKPFMTREQQSKAMKFTLVKIALTGLILTYVAMDVDKKVST